MQITISLREILNQGCWEEFCELKGWNVWCMNEGLADSKETVTLTIEECKQIRLRISDE